MFKKTLAALATISATNLVLLWINKPGSANAAAIPNQAEVGDSTPADSNSEAHPMMQRGGTAVSATVTAVVHGRRDTRCVQQKSQGSDRSAAAAIHMTTALAPLDRQYAL